MGNTKAEDAMKELTLMLLYLSRFTQGEKFHEATDFYAWKGYDLAEKLAKKCQRLCKWYRWYTVFRY